MDVLTIEDLRSLTGRSGGPCVSIFLDTHATAPANRQDPVTLKSLLKSAEEQLGASGMRPAEAAGLLEPARSLGEDGLFWRPRPGGVAIFLAPGEAMRVLRLPLAFEPQVVVNARFHIKPLIGAVDRGERFHVLALSQKQVRLFAGGRAGLDEVDLGDMPRNIADALRNDGFDEQLQMHTSSSGQRPGGGRGAAMFHGSGGADTGITKRYLTEYVKRVAAGVRDVIGEPGTPLVVAAVDYLGAMYREADRTHQVAEEIVTGSPETLGPTDLHVRAWPIAERVFATERDAALVRLREAGATSRAVHGAARVVEAALAGRVDALFLTPGASVWGAVRADGTANEHADCQPGDEDLADLAVVGTVLHAGRVWTAPDLAEPMAALLRY